MTTPGASRTRATSVAKYQPPERISARGRRRSRRRRRAGRRGRRTRRRTRRRGWRRRSAPCAASSSTRRDEVLLAGAVHAAGRLVEGDGGDAVVVEPAGEGDARARRWRSPPERSRGSASIACSMPTARRAAAPARRAARRRRARARGVAGFWGAGPSAGDVDPAGDGIDQAGRGAQQGALAGAVAAHQRTRSPGRPRVDAAQDVARAVAVVELDPEVGAARAARGAPAARRSASTTGGK